MYVIGIPPLPPRPRTQKREKGAEETLEDAMAANILKLLVYRKPHNQKAQRTPSKIDTKQTENQPSKNK